MIELERLLVVLMLFEVESHICRVVSGDVLRVSKVELTSLSSFSSFLKFVELVPSSFLVDPEVIDLMVVVILMMVVLRLLKVVHERLILRTQAR